MNSVDQPVKESIHDPLLIESKPLEKVSSFTYCVLVMLNVKEEEEEEEVYL